MNVVHAVFFAFLPGASAAAAAVSIVGPCWVVGQVFLPGFQAGEAYVPGFQAGEAYKPGFQGGQETC